VRIAWEKVDEIADKDDILVGNLIKMKLMRS
jgi:hypothetical protein